MKPTDTKLTPTEVAEMLNVSQRTLIRWHALRIGPARCKVGRTVLYRESAIDAWLAKNETHPVRTFRQVEQ
jgi:excisionase family DNA binding protein